MTSVLGRDRELAIALDSLKRAGRGHGEVVLIEGEAGIGKTRLLDALLAGGRAMGSRTFRGAAEEIERAVPFRALFDAFSRDARAAALLGDLLLSGSSDAGTLDAPLEPGMGEIRYQVVDRFVALLAEMAQTRSLVVGLEDLHWADPSSLFAVHILAKRIRDLPVAMLLTLRPAPVAPEVKKLVDALSTRGVTRLELGPLDEASVDALVEDAIGAPPSPALRRHVAGAGGNPFYVLALVSALRDGGLIAVEEGRAEVRTTEVPSSLAESIVRRLSFLTDDTLRLLRLAAVLGASFELEDLALFTGEPVTRLLPRLEESIRGGAVEDSGERLRFRHDLVRDALYRSIPDPIRSALHLQAGRALAGANRPPARVAAHLAVGSPRGDAQAIDWLRRAARDAAPRAPSIAAELLERALELVEPWAEGRNGLLAELVPALAFSGRPGEAEAIARSALRGALSPADVGRLRWGLAEALAMQGRMKEALPYLEAAARERGLPEGQRARLLAEASQWMYYTGDIASAAATAQEAHRLGDRLDEDLAACLAWGTLSRIALERGEIEEAIALGSRALTRAAESGAERASTTGWIHPSFELGAALIEAGRFAEAERVIETGRRLREELGSAWDRPLFSNQLAHLHLYWGRWDDAVAEAKTTLAFMKEGGAQTAILWTYTLLAYVALHRGEIEEARDAISRANDVLVRSSGRMASDLVLSMRALLIEIDGDTKAASDVADEAWHLEMPFKWVTRSRMAPDVVRIHISAGREERAIQVCDALDERARLASNSFVRGTALHCRGMLERDERKHLAAVAELGKANRIVEMARAREDAADTLAMKGERDRALALLRDAVETYERVGAYRDVARAEARRRALGFRRGVRGRRTRAAVGWDSLTPTEREVVRLVGKGLTNLAIGTQLFVSHRTIESHLTSVYRKLGVSSRTELAAAAARRSS